jgi:hypothetical protein
MISFRLFDIILTIYTFFFKNVFITTIYLFIEVCFPYIKSLFKFSTNIFL